MTVDNIPQGESPRLRTGRSVVRGKRYPATAFECVFRLFGLFSDIFSYRHTLHRVRACH